MLNNSEYAFNKFTENDFDSDNIFYVYGDNMLESIQIIELLYKFNKEKISNYEVKYISLSEFVYILTINNIKYYFIVKAYYHNGRLPTIVRKTIKELDKPDAIIYSKKDKKIIMVFESTATTLAGNATWQRIGRIIYSLENNIPFAFFAYFSKIDQSNDQIRKPSELFVLLFIMLSLKYSTPALLGFYHHQDPSQNDLKFKKFSDWRKNIFKYLFSLIINAPDYDILRSCYKNYKDYYCSPDTIYDFNTNFGEFNLSYIRNDNFEYNIVEDIKNKNNTKLFYKKDLYLVWQSEVKQVNDFIKKNFSKCNFYQLSANCSVSGITFDTNKLIESLEKKLKFYLEDVLDPNIPTIIIPIRLTKSGKFTSDPYNGIIPAFSNLYDQSFKKINIIILLYDHSKAKEYDVNSAKNIKTYKAINKYANLLIDLDLNNFDTFNQKSELDPIEKYKKIKLTEDNITSFFKTILDKEGIEISYINPPNGPWSDVKLHNNHFEYLGKEDKRSDIVFYNKRNLTYYIGESKESFKSFIKTLNKEEDKAKNLKKKIEDNVVFNYDYKLFALSKGSCKDYKYIITYSNFKIVALVQETNKKITLKIIE